MSSDSATDSVETPYGWVVVAASLAMITVAFGTSYMVVVGLKPIAADFGWPRWVPSAAYSAILLGAGVGGVLMGWWADRRGMGGPALTSGIMVGLGLLLAGRVTEIWQLLAVNALIVGMLGTGGVFAPMLTNTTRWFDRRRGLAVAIVATGQSAAGAIWPPVIRWAIDEIGWRATWTWYGLFALATMVPLSLLLRRHPPGGLGPPTGAAAARAAAATAARLGSLHPHLAHAMLSLAIVGCCVAMAMPMVHVVALCSDLGFEPARGAEMLSLLLACGLVSRLAFGWLSDRIGGLATILIGAAMQAAVLTLYTVVHSLFGLYLVSGAFGLVFGGIVPAYALATRELFPAREAGWRIGVVFLFLFGTVGMALGGFLGGLIFDLTASYHVAFLVGVAFNLVNLAMIGTLMLAGGPRGRLQPA